MKKNSMWTLVAAAGSVGMFLMACDTLSKVNRALDDFHKLANNANGAITDARAAASNASPSFSPSTGGTAWNERGGENAPKHANEPGKSGQIQEDMDGDGTAETVDVFVPDSDPDATYMSWSQAGVCYLYANEGGAEHLIQWDCADDSTYYGCNLTANVCEVCANTCSTCPTDFTDWAECAEGGQQGTGGEGYGGQSYGGSGFGTEGGFGGSGGAGGFGGSGGEGTCAPGCEPSRLADGICDEACYVDACGFDSGDCPSPCFDFCSDVLMQCTEPTDGACYAACTADPQGFATCWTEATDCASADACYP